LHRLLENQSGISVRLSKENAQDARAKMAHSREPAGISRSAAGCGSHNDSKVRTRVDLAVPCSPWTKRIGWGMSRKNAATTQPIASR